MKIYKNHGGNSGITHYEITPHSVEIKFRNVSSVYIYSDAKITSQHIEKMKKLAEAGKGLGTYVNQHPEVRDNAVTK